MTNSALMASIATSSMGNTLSHDAKATLFTLQIGFISYARIVYAAITLVLASRIGYDNMVLGICALMMVILTLSKHTYLNINQSNNY